MSHVWFEESSETGPVPLMVLIATPSLWSLQKHTFRFYFERLKTNTCFFFRLFGNYSQGNVTCSLTMTSSNMEKKNKQQRSQGGGDNSDPTLPPRTSLTLGPALPLPFTLKAKLTPQPPPPCHPLHPPCTPWAPPPPGGTVLLHLTSVTLLPHRWIRCRGVVPVELMLCNMRPRVAGANKNMCLTVRNTLQRPFKRIKGLQ